jgi:hypothetical protein
LWDVTNKNIVDIQQQIIIFIVRESLDGTIVPAHVIKVGRGPYFFFQFVYFRHCYINYRLKVAKLYGMANKEGYLVVGDNAQQRRQSRNQYCMASK